MSYQLVISLPCQTPASGTKGGYGFVHSATMPIRLRDEVTRVAEFEGRGNRHNSAFRYSYCVRSINGTDYHILSRTLLPGSENDPAIVHCLVLSPDEVQALRNNSARPTPAGLILALENKGYWCTLLPENASELNSEPTLTASALPDASTQSTWKHLTGHKSNARTFFTPPYDKACLLLLPSHVEGEEVLMLIHESDWLTSARGWKRTFTTNGGPEDRIENTQRISVPAIFPVSSVENWKGVPTILPDEQLVLKRPESITDAQPLKSGSLVNNTSVYQYAEGEDVDTYPVTVRSLSRLQRWAIVLACLLALAFATNFLVCETVDDAGNIAGKVLTEEIPSPGKAVPQAPRQEPGIEVRPQAEEPIPVHPEPPLEATPDDVPSAIADDTQAGTAEENETAGEDIPRQEPDAQEGPSEASAADFPTARETLVITEGQEVPAALAHKLSAEGVHATVFTLQEPAKQYSGKLSPAAAEGVPHRYLLHDNGVDVPVTFGVEDGKLVAPAADGTPACVQLDMPGGAVVLIPALRYTVGDFECNGLTTLPFISRIRPAGVYRGKDGRLRWKKDAYPQISIGQIAHTKQQLPPLVLPKLLGKTPVPTCVPTEGQPMILTFTHRPDKSNTAGGYAVYHTKLCLANPFYGKSGEIFQEIAESKRLIPGSDAYTYSSLYRLAESLESNTNAFEDVAEYARALQEIAGRIELPAIRMERDNVLAQATGRDLKLALCNAMAKEIAALYEKARAEANAYRYRAPLQLQLESIRVDENSKKSYWTFVLKEQPQPAP